MSPSSFILSVYVLTPFFLHCTYAQSPRTDMHRLAKIDSDRIEKWSKLESKVESFLEVTYCTTER